MAMKNLVLMNLITVSIISMINSNNVNASAFEKSSQDNFTWGCITTSSGYQRSIWIPEFLLSYVIYQKGYEGPCADLGDKRKIGNAYLQTFVQKIPESNKLWSIGIVFPESALNNLPTTPSDGQNCYDIDQNGVLTFESQMECVGGHQIILDFPNTKDISPFKWGLVNWNPQGHAPEGIYSVAHFDFHFYVQNFIARNFIRLGSCGMVINCDDYETARKPIDAAFMPQDYTDVGAVEGRMGNHLVDLTAPEFGQDGSEAFTQTFIYGAYDGKLSFWEPMVRYEHLLSKTTECKTIKQPLSYSESGQYPMTYCIRYRSTRQEYVVSLENFISAEVQ
jgi:hypothetical protein